MPNPQLLSLIRFFHSPNLKRASVVSMKKAEHFVLGFLLRRMRDSNPRYREVRRFSRPVHSTTLAILRAKSTHFLVIRKAFQKKISDFFSYRI